MQPTHASGLSVEVHKLKPTINRHIRALRQDMLSFTKDLIRIRTENPPGSCYEECVRMIAQKLERFAMRPKIIRVKGRVASHPRYCLLSSYGTGNRALYFHGHYDVVPASSERQYDPKVHRGRLYGRGASDMKAGLSAMIYAIRAMQLSGIKMGGRVCLVIVPDEETGGNLGTRYLFQRGYIRKKNSIGMLMPEPTSGAIWNACRGALSLMITVKGKPVHVVLQQKGINAFEHMHSLVNALLKLKHAVEKRKTDYAVARGESRHSVLMLGGICKCGTNFNVVPGHCSFSIDRRINPEENLTQEKRRLLSLIDEFRKKGMNITTSLLQEGEAMGCSAETLLANYLARSIAVVKGRRPQFLMCPGLLEIRYYLMAGIPAYAYGPGLLQQAHHPDEFVLVDRIYECAAVYALTAIAVLSGRGVRC
jgi:succinyl-diaminopimelate desuccinylase